MAAKRSAAIAQRRACPTAGGRFADRREARDARALFDEHRGVLLRGWWLADDGRMYHRGLTSCVLAMMHKRRSDADRQASKRAKDAAQSRATRPDSDATHGGVTRDAEVTSGGVTRESSTYTDTYTDKVSDEAGASSSSAQPPTSARNEPSKSKPSLPCPYGKIVAAYHEALPSLPRVRLLDGKVGEQRKKAMRERWGWVLRSCKPDGSRRATDADAAFEWFRAYFDRAAGNDFLMGRTPRGAGHEQWRCDLDFLLSDRGMKHVIERTVEEAA